jgi:putative salt-induced outer membrane protein YdiY
MRAMLGVLLFAMVAVASGEDEVKLKNGDRITGTVKSLAGGKLVVETAHSGALKIDWAQVASLKVDAPIKVRLATGETLEGKIGPGAEGRLKIESGGTAAPVEVDPAKVTHFNQPPAEWHGAFTAAAKATDGNTHVRSFLIAGEGIRDTEADQLLLRAIFRYAEQSGVLSERNAYGIVKYSYKLTPRLYAYLSEELLGDTFKDLSLGSVTSIGLGYVLVKEEWIDLSVEAGIAYFSNNFNVAKDESHIGGRAAVKFRMALPLGFELKETFTIYPNFEDSQDFQIRNEATLGTQLGKGWSLLGGVITEFDKTPSPGLERRDDTYFIGLGYSF